MELLGRRNGIGGQVMTLAIVESSSARGVGLGDERSRSSRPSRAGSASRPRLRRAACSRSWNRVATPKLPPPPRIAQNRSGCDSSLHAQDLAVRGHDLGGEQVVDRETVLADEEADSAAEREPADPDRTGVAEGRRQAVVCRGLRVLGRSLGLSLPKLCGPRRRCRARSGRGGRARCRPRSCCGPGCCGRRSGSRARSRSRARLRSPGETSSALAARTIAAGRGHSLRRRPCGLRRSRALPAAVTLPLRSARSCGIDMAVVAPDTAIPLSRWV